MLPSLRDAVPARTQRPRARVAAVPQHSPGRGGPGMRIRELPAIELGQPDPMSVVSPPLMGEGVDTSGSDRDGP